MQIAQNNIASIKTVNEEIIAKNTSILCPATQEITISEYIFHRIHQLGIKSIFGVPGDFNLRFLEHIYDVKGLNWIGCCNELNAAYAADAYAKASQKMGVLLTTYGVGELSAINGVAGAFTEYAPILHLVGTSALALKRNPAPLNLHHLLANKQPWKKSDHYVYERVAAEFSVDSASIEDNSDEACEMIDRVILNVWRNSRPGYIFLPCDLAEMKVDIQRLAQPIELCYEVSNNQKRINEVVEEILSLLYQASSISIVADEFIRKFRMENEFNLLLEKLNGKVNLFSTMYGKGIINEDDPRFVGAYTGSLETPVANLVKQSDLVLHIGVFNNELNCGNFTFDIDSDKMVELSSQYVKVGGKFDESVNMMDVLQKLVELLDVSKVSTAPVFEKPLKYFEIETSEKKEPLTEVDLIKSLGNTLESGDVLIVETCSFLFAVPEIKLKNSKLILQAYWASIGYALPATLGASLALRDFNLPGKVYTVEGDGSAQMSLQELSSMLRYDIDATLILLNNSGYTIERVITGPYSSYNDINTNWQWCEMLKCFGDVKQEKSQSFNIKTDEELNRVLHSGIYNNGKFKLLELILPMFDVPDKLNKLIEMNRKR